MGTKTPEPTVIKPDVQPKNTTIIDTNWEEKGDTESKAEGNGS